MSIVIYVGEQGCGKTTALKRKVRWFMAQRRKSPVFIHDLRGWWQPDGGIPVGALAPEGARYPTVQHFLDSGVSKQAGNAGGNYFRAQYRVNLFYECPAADVFRLAQLFLRKKSPCIVVCDELDQLPPQLDQRRDAAYHCLHYGRVVPVDILGSARMPQNIDKGWLSQASEVHLFRLTTMQALRQFERAGWTGGPELVRRLPTLGDYEYLSVIKQRVQMRG